MIMRICRTCRESKDMSEFWSQATRTDGLQSECKLCMRDRNNEWQRKHKAARHESKLRGVYDARKANQRAAWIKAAKQRAKKNGVPWTLWDEDIEIPDTCPVLGIPLKSQIGTGLKRGNWNLDSSPSLDRVDNSLGYVPGNVIVISNRANRLKSNASIEELRKIVEFYDARKRREFAARSEDFVSAAQDGGKPNHLPAVLASSQEKIGPMSFGEDRP